VEKKRGLRGCGWMGESSFSELGRLAVISSTMASNGKEENPESPANVEVGKDVGYFKFGGKQKNTADTR
jgi:hypothetical protein